MQSIISSSVKSTLTEFSMLGTSEDCWEIYEFTKCVQWCNTSCQNFTKHMCEYGESSECTAMLLCGCATSDIGLTSHVMTHEYWSDVSTGPTIWGHVEILLGHMKCMFLNILHHNTSNQSERKAGGNHGNNMHYCFSVQQETLCDHTVFYILPQPFHHAAITSRNDADLGAAQK